MEMYQQSHPFRKGGKELCCLYFPTHTNPVSHYTILSLQSDTGSHPSYSSRQNNTTTIFLLINCCRLFVESSISSRSSATMMKTNYYFFLLSSIWRWSDRILFLFQPQGIQHSLQTNLLTFHLDSFRTLNFCLFLTLKKKVVDDEKEKI